MQIPATTSTTSTQPSSSTTTSQTPTVDYNAFLTLLVTQLKNQDPTAPTDSTAFMSQLASFSNVEQSVQMNSKFDSLLSMTQLTQADGLIGRTASSTDGSVSGLVKSVRIDSNGVVATLDNGATLNVNSGLILS
jgi:flagellar basal-body rod modification protein FlgD